MHPVTSHWPPLGMMRARRFFEKGVLRFIILDLLSNKPAHGYEIIRAMEERSRGLYSPSPGSIYPILQLLQDLGYVTSTDSEGKKTYTITETGRAYLAEHADIIKGLHQFSGAHRGHEWVREEFRDTAEELRRLGHLFMSRAPHLSREQIGKIRDTVKRAASEIESIIEQ